MQYVIAAHSQRVEYLYPSYELALEYVYGIRRRQSEYSTTGKRLEFMESQLNPQTAIYRNFLGKDIHCPLSTVRNGMSGAIRRTCQAAVRHHYIAQIKLSDIKRHAASAILCSLMQDV